ncbi:MAG: hypothetical protein H0W73_12430 [Bacteroidetes bacterium]|nr:hypothetical protein [Bacteroidota bacterium]
MKLIFKIAAFLLLAFVLIFDLTSCKKDKLILDSSAKVQFSQDSVLFDTVFTTIGSSTRNIRVRNKNDQPIKISSIDLVGGSTSPFIINVDGSPGRSFIDVEIAANDSMYIFIQVNVNPNNALSPLIINDAIKFVVNGNEQTVYLEAWGQDAYYYYPTNAIKFKDGSYLPYSRISEADNAVINFYGDKPHVIYGYLVVDSTQKLIINAGAKIYLNNKAGLWVYRYGELKVNGQKGNEVIFTGARREKDYRDEPGQWDRIWINEGSVNNSIDYAIIKNGTIGVQAELMGGAGVVFATEPRRLKITNTKIQNMSIWGFYGVGYNVYGGNNVFSSCQEHSINLTLGGKYTFLHCTFANFWEKEKTRDKPTINISNHVETYVFPLDSAYFGNCIVDGKLTNEIGLDLDESNTSFPPKFTFSNCWLKTGMSTSDVSRFKNDIRKGSGSLAFVDYGVYDFHATNETRTKNFSNPDATTDAQKFLFDLDGPTSLRNTTIVTIGAYEN